jgi:5'-phosphate synthase pdxT subunit
VTTAGVLALQGDVAEHIRRLQELGASTHAVKTLEDLEQVDALVIPGGESTTIGFMLDEHDLIEPLRKRIEDGMPTFGTCAGAILLSDDVRGDGDRTWPKIGGLNVVINRNGYGRQVDSFEATVAIEGVGQVEAVFIRAPVIESVGDGVTVLATTRERPVVVRQDNILAATFHPELTADVSLHRFFLEEVCR